MCACLPCSNLISFSALLSLARSLTHSRSLHPSPSPQLSCLTDRFKHLLIHIGIDLEASIGSFGKVTLEYVIPHDKWDYIDSPIGHFHTLLTCLYVRIRKMDRALRRRWFMVPHMDLKRANVCTALPHNTCTHCTLFPSVSLFLRLTLFPSLSLFLPAQVSRRAAGLPAVKMSCRVHDSESGSDDEEQPSDSSSCPPSASGESSESEPFTSQ